MSDETRRLVDEAVGAYYRHGKYKWSGNQTQLAIDVARRALDTHLAKLELEADTKAKTSKAWEDLYNERNRLWRAAEDKIVAVGELLAENGCDCDCEHVREEHDEDCELCLACRIDRALRGAP